ncbi:tRNA epoxyqueuosine(34) reductase QueG [Akkermansia sp. NBRC 115031]|uniref:tRNA epoxyqueuosine(34) reductase QueG n=1 Tax=unclassified Akkermansia TaxID=2608915 RepID=UPI002557B236|nr:tRNA epoxyqueuosine(34) reductase QueG [Akkermansia sp. NBRC 115031]
MKKILGGRGALVHDAGVLTPDPDVIKDSLCAVSRQLGFSGCRVARAGRSPHAEKLFQWLERGWHAGMEWMARSPERRADPAEVLSGCRSVICLSYDYDSPAMRPEGEGSICLYAHGRDYHGILEEKLADLQELLSIYGGEQKGYVDAGPVMERDHAEACGLGWRGRSGLIVRRKGGSRFFIATLLTTLELEPDAPVSHGCGSCRRCADLCPTGAIMENGQVDAGRCLSYWTIEHRGSIPEEIRPLVGTRLYGCDTCVTVCPWNGKPLPEADERFRMSRLLASIPLRDLLALDAGGFADLFRNSPLKRIKREGLLRNGCIVLGNAGTPDDIDFLKALSGESPLVAEHASWAVERILRRHGRHACSSGARD